MSGTRRAEGAPATLAIPTRSRPTIRSSSATSSAVASTLRSCGGGGGLERTTSYYHLDREAAVRRDEERRFARRRTLAPGELRLPRDLYERRGIASSDEEEEALREKMVKGAVVLGARATSLVFGLPKHSSPDVKTIERRVKHIPIP